MNPARTLATARRILLQVRHDPRTIAMLLGVPVVLMGLLSWILRRRGSDFDVFGPPLLGIFPLVVMFLITSVTTLRERTSGTLERLLTLRVGKADFVIGYALAFGAAAVAQAVVASALSFGAFGLRVHGSVTLVAVVAVMDALLGTASGLALSALATTEFQAVQFMPAFILPQVLLCGIIVPRPSLPVVLRIVSDALPMSYAVDATRDLAFSGHAGSGFWLDLVIVAAFMVGALSLGALTLRRQTG